MTIQKPEVAIFAGNVRTIRLIASTVQPLEGKSLVLLIKTPFIRRGYFPHIIFGLW
jgi:hypothetical protein